MADYLGNLYRQFRQLLPEPPLLVGEVTGTAAGVCTVELPGGGLIRALGSASPGQRVFVRDGVVQGLAPALRLERIEV